VSAPAARHYRFPNAERIVAARIDAPELIPYIEDFYSAYRCGRESDATLRDAIAAERDGKIFRVSVASGGWEAKTLGDAVLFYEYELTAALLEDAGDFVHLHGAAIHDASCCIVLLGPSGAGKSTLTLALGRAGWTALADDAVLIDPGSGEVQPFERSIRVHEASLKELGIDAADVPGGRLCEPYLWLEPGADTRSAHRPNLFVFLDAGRTTRLEPLSVSATLRELLMARLSDQPERDFECLNRLAADVPGYRLAFASFAEALAELERISAGDL
jgi:hypothetical protein